MVEPTRQGRQLEDFISPRTLVGDVDELKLLMIGKPKGFVHPLGRIFGYFVGFSVQQHMFDGGKTPRESYRFAGKFRAVNHDGEVHDAGILYMPGKFVHDAIGTLKGAGEGAVIEFEVDITAISRGPGAMIPYSFGVVMFAETEADARISRMHKQSDRRVAAEKRRSLSGPATIEGTALGAPESAEEAFSGK